MRTIPARLLVSLLALLVLSMGALSADDITSGFERANALYAEGKYTEATAAYDKLAQSGKTSSALYFNLGNAWFKCGQIGRAIANYRLGHAMAPRDPDLRANLQFARNHANAGTAAQGIRWSFLWHGLSLNEWTTLAACLGWLWLALLTLGQLRPELRRHLSGYTATSGVICAICLIGLGLRAYHDLGATPAVVVAAETTVRYGPLEESRGFYTLTDGAEVEIVDQQNNWLQVRDASRRIGWLRRDQVMVLGSIPVVH